VLARVLLVAEAVGARVADFGVARKEEEEEDDEDDEREGPASEESSWACRASAMRRLRLKQRTMS